MKSLAQRYIMVVKMIYNLVPTMVLMFSVETSYHLDLAKMTDMGNSVLHRRPF